MSRLDQLISKHLAGELDDAERMEALELAESNEPARKQLNAVGFFTGGEKLAEGEELPAEFSEVHQPTGPRRKTPPIAKVFFLFAALLILGTMALVPLLAIEAPLAEVEKGEVFYNGEAQSIIYEPTLISVPKGEVARIEFRGGVNAEIVGPATVDIRLRGTSASVELISGIMRVGRPTFEEGAYFQAGPFVVKPGEGCRVAMQVKNPTGPGAEKAGFAKIEVLSRRAEMQQSSRASRYQVDSPQLEELPTGDDFELFSEGTSVNATLSMSGKQE